MNADERQMIESLFQRLAQAAPQAGPRDPEAEALIQQRFQALPGAAYYMAQTLIVQERALQQAEARLAAAGGGGGSFLPPGTAGAASPYGPAAQAPYAQPQQQQRGMGGFLAGAGKIALGVGGGILVADAVMGLGHELFGQGYQQGFEGLDRDDRGLDRGYAPDDRSYGPDDRDDGGFDQQDQSSDWGGSDDSGGSSDW